MLGSGDAIWFSDGKGKPLTPPHNPVNAAAPGTTVPGYANALSEIENPNPRPSTNNYYTQDGYGGGSGSPDSASLPTPITAADPTPIAPTPASPALRPS